MPTSGPSTRSSAEPPRIRRQRLLLTIDTLSGSVETYANALKEGPTP